MSQVANDDRHDEAGYRGEGVGDGDEGASEVGREVDVIGQESAVHAADARYADRH